MRHNRHRHLLLLATLLLTLFVAASRGDVAGAADPDFTNVADILGGQRHLLRDDDLVFGQVPNFQRYVLGTSGLQIANQEAETVVSASCGGTIPSPMPFQTRVGRLFNLNRDVMVSLAPLSTAGSGCGGNPNMAFYIQDPQDASNTSQSSETLSPNFNQLALADFNGDGYTDLFYLNDQFAIIYTAANPDEPSQGVTEVAQLGLGAPYAPRADPVTGDFNGDGALDVAWVGQVGSGPSGVHWVVFFASVCPAQGSSVLGQTCARAFQIILSTQSIDVGPLMGPDSATHFVVLTAGNYDGAVAGETGLPVQRLVVVRNVTDSAFVLVQEFLAYTFDAMLTPSQASTLRLAIGEGITLDPPVVASGRLGWFGQTDQLVFTSMEIGLSVVTFEANLTMTAHTTANIVPPASNCLPYCTVFPFGLAVGRFDPPDVRGTLNPNLQIALLGVELNFDTGLFETLLQIFTVDPSNNNFTPQATSTYVIANETLFPGYIDPSTGFQSRYPYGNLLWAGDLQGRSLALGAPTKVTVTSHLQPDIVLGIPPMHIDWINPVLPGTTPGLPSACQQAPTPCVLNLTVKPSVPAPGVGFSTQYAFASSASSNASRKSTTSYSFSTREGAEAKASYGVPSLVQVSVDAKFSAQQTHDGTVADTYNTYSGQRQSVSATTGFADHLFYTESRLNLYYYPVIGRSVCPADQPTCAESDERPLQVVFSGPDQVAHQDLDATTQEWYQPAHEPGNIFSYPWTVAQLQQSLPRLTALTGDPDQPVWRGTDTSSSAYSATWNQGTTAEQSSGSVSTAKMDASVTVAEQASIAGFGISGSASFAVNSSRSVSTLNTTTQTLEASTGIQVNKPAFTDLVADNYLYSFAGYVLGQAPPDGTLQSIPLEDAAGQPIDLQSTGPLTVAFLADPFQVNLPWWRQAYTRPDVGLHHPERWDWAKATQTAAFNPADQGSSTPQDQPFYRIKGLFITPQGAGGLGPQLTQATAGDTLQLQARVYNFSLADMAAGTQVHVRFYGQRYENAQLLGASFLIGEDVIGPIPGFNSTSTNGEAPNWALAATTFETSGRADQYLLFWVLVWMQDGQGTVVAELPGHGLTGAITPATPFAQITGVPIEPYSNNVGFYGYTGTGFYLAAPGAEPGATSIQPGDLTVDHLRVDGSPAIPLDRKAKVTLSLHTGDVPLGPLAVVFYDGEPDQGGTPFDILHLAHLRPDATTRSRVFFRPQTCGPHTLVAVAGPATAAPATGRTSVEVTLDPVAAIEALIATTQGLALPQGLAHSLLATLAAAAQAFAKGTTTAGTHQLQAYMTEVQAQRGKQLAAPQADALTGQAQVILGCV
jgi:hypothetical protein